MLQISDESPTYLKNCESDDDVFPINAALVS